MYCIKKHRCIHRSQTSFYESISCMEENMNKLQNKFNAQKSDELHWHKIQNLGQVNPLCSKFDKNYKNVRDNVGLLLATMTDIRRGFK